MNLFVCFLIFIFACGYAIGMRKMVKELAIYKTQEERRERQIIPMILGMTAFFSIFVIQIIRFGDRLF